MADNNPSSSSIVQHQQYQQVQQQELENGLTEVQTFYQGTSIFLTGGSGFLGKLVLEKILRSLYGVEKVYLLMREKKGVNPKERLEDIFKSALFERLKEEQPGCMEKCSLLIGDCEKPNLGLNDESIETLKSRVDCIIHCAATVRFDEKIRKAAYINVRASKDLLKIAKEMQKLKLLLYVSTAYSHCPKTSINEIFYDPPMCPEKLLTMVDILTEDQLEKITPIILGKFPNTYVFTKAVAEDAVKKEGKGLPLVIVRPSIVVSTNMDPVPGWIDNIYGPTGVLYGASLGLLHILQAAPKKISDLVPADHVVSTILTAGPMVHKEKLNDVIINNSSKGSGFGDKERQFKSDDDIYIFNYVSGSEMPLTWGEFKYLALKYGHIYRPLMQIWYTFFFFCENTLLYRLGVYLFHFLPAYLADGVARLVGKEPMMVKAYKKIDKFSNVITYFAMRQWNFSNENTQQLWKSLKKDDQDLFKLSMSNFDWHQFFANYCLGGRIYFLKDPKETIPKAKRKHIILGILHYTVVTLFLLFLYKFVILSLI